MGNQHDWKVVHGHVERLARAKRGYDHEEGTWLLLAKELGVHLRLGYGSFFEYVGRLFGYTPRETAERLRVAGALRGLPRLREALDRGEVHWTAVRELSRVATGETEAAWLEAARGKTVREIELAVSGRVAGDHPEDAADPDLLAKVLRFDATAATAARWLMRGGSSPRRRGII